MQALKETTVWDNKSSPNHMYLLDGNNLIAYIRQGTTEPKYFKQPIKGFSKAGRKFESVSVDLFNAHVATHANFKEVVGSKGDVYLVNLDENTCSCPGYTYRGTCKHTKELIDG
jgi:hypothetical protein